MATAAAPRPTLRRRFTQVIVLSLCLFLLLQAALLEIYEVPTGSMAPTLRGAHRSTLCPRCGCELCIGRHPRELREHDAARCYRRAYCHNCGATDLHLHEQPLRPGERLLVARHVFDLRPPRRWELIVFRLFGLTFVKRVLGLPGELLEIREGDVYIDRTLLRKDLDLALALSVPVHDMRHVPRGLGWQQRWQVAPPAPAAHPVQDGTIHLDGTKLPRAWLSAAYQQFWLDEQQSAPLRDEYLYNAGQAAPSEPIHDFLVEADVEVLHGSGWLALSLTDGQEVVCVHVPVNNPAAACVLTRQGTAAQLLVREGSAVLAQGSLMLSAGVRQHVQMAFVDRRVQVRIDHGEVLRVDLPAPTKPRAAVTTPLCVAVQDCSVRMHHLRLARDLHYTQTGRQGILGQPVHLGAEQYFVLGDNSACSEDSRCWPAPGAVPTAAILGKPLARLATRSAGWRWLP